jgi:hypothetical protein
MSVSESTFPGGVARCQHIRSNGTQCGSPALKSRQFCYYHQHSRPEPVALYLDGERYSDGQIIMPLFEDAHSIQVVLRQVTQLLLQRRIERKDAALALYALQIASSNLKRMEREKPRPTQVVIDPETVAETPLGMTPWSATGNGHDPDNAPLNHEANAASGAPNFLCPDQFTTGQNFEPLAAGRGQECPRYTRTRNFLAPPGDRDLVAR